MKNYFSILIILPIFTVKIITKAETHINVLSHDFSDQLTALHNVVKMFILLHTKLCLHRVLSVLKPRLLCIYVVFQSIPEVPPKPGELRTELHGYKAREEAAAALRKLEEKQNAD